ncbi:MAG: hypothetical protein EXS14_01835 [Planctomycetes bacterium]|nr:hypothetical protein [Planctomycetota bacterium]
MSAFLRTWTDDLIAGSGYAAEHYCALFPNVPPELIHAEIERAEQALPHAGELRVDAVLVERYHLIRLIGSGSFGTVWEAEDLRLRRRVALKMSRSVSLSRLSARKKCDAQSRS